MEKVQAQRGDGSANCSLYGSIMYQFHIVIIIAIAPMDHPLHAETPSQLSAVLMRPPLTLHNTRQCRRAAEQIALHSVHAMLKVGYWASCLLQADEEASKTCLLCEMLHKGGLSGACLSHQQHRLLLRGCHSHGLH